ncbi:hypothetical protein [Streptomyces tricolor]|uniref:hypothetical protein n=1 Tax=Streptomyces tricolor TaxID=68277 RepID=UPI003D74EB65
MDQGLAAVLGAAVGAIATGGGAMITVRSASRLQRRQTRREVYQKFIDAAQNSDELQSRLTHPELEIGRDGVVAFRESIDSLRTLLPLVYLEGPDSVMVEAQKLVALGQQLVIVSMHHLLENWGQIDEALRRYSSVNGAESDRARAFERMGDAYHEALFDFVKTARSKA